MPPKQAFALSRSEQLGMVRKSIKKIQKPIFHMEISAFVVKY